MRISLRWLCLLAVSAHLISCATGDMDESLDGGESGEISSEEDFESSSSDVPEEDLAVSDASSAQEEDLSLDDEGGGDTMALDQGAEAVEQELALDEDKQAEVPEDLAMSEEVPAPEVVAQEPPPPAIDEPAPVEEPAPQPVAEEKMIQITDLQFLASEKGGTVLIKTSETARFTTRQNADENQYIVEVENAILPNRLKRPYITKEFQGSVASINAYQDAGSNTARIVIQLREAIDLQVDQEGNNLMVAAIGGDSAPNAGLARSEQSAAPTASHAHDEKSGIEGSGASTFDEFITGETKFYGRKINIEVTDEDVRNVFGLIAEESGANIVLDDKVTGNITVKLRQVPWDQALVVVMKAKGLGYVRQGNVLRIAQMDALKKESDTAREIVESRQKLDPLKVKVIPVSYANVDDLVKQSEKFLSPRGKLASDNRTSSIIITDTAETIERLARLIKTLDVSPDQVLIEGKIVEAKDTFSRDIGVKWNMSGSPVALGSSPSGLPVSLNPSTSFASGVAQNTLGLNMNLNIGTLDILGDLTASLALYETEQVVKVVSSPRVVTMNREKSFISQSDQEPVLQITQNANQPSTTSIRYEPAELRLEVVPQITTDGGVIMDIDVKREFFGAASSNGSKPKFARQAKTRVLVHTGQTAVIGGIYDNNQTDGESGIPLLRKIPIFGWLFKNRNRQNNKNELIIFLTPRILGRAESSQGSL